MSTSPHTSLQAAVIEPVGGHSGMDYYDFGLCEGLQAAGVQTTLYTCDETTPPPDAPFQTKTAYQSIFGSDPTWKRGLRYVRGSLHALWDAKKKRAQIAHFHLFHVGPLEFLNILLAKLLGLKVVITAHDVAAFVQHLSVPYLVLRAYRWADCVIAHNEMSRQEVIDGLGVPPCKALIVPSGNYLHAIQPLPSQAAARSELGLSLTAPVLLFFGQIKTVKGLDVLLEALPALVVAHPDLKVVIAGRVWKDDFQKYQDLIDKHQLAEVCDLHIRFIEHAEMSVFFAAADLIVLPYRKIYQSAVLIMSMSYGKPVVVSDLPGMVDIVDDEETGFVFPTEDSAALAATIKHALARPEHVQQVAHNGLHLMQTAYSWHEVGRQTAACYTALLKG